MANDFQAVSIFIGDDSKIRIGIESKRCINQLAVDFSGQRGFRQTRANARGDFGNGDRTYQRSAWNRRVR